MKYGPANIPDMTLDELEAADWDLAEKEFNFNESLKNTKFEKLNPKPQLGETFKKLRQEIKNAIEVKKNGN